MEKGKAEYVIEDIAGCGLFQALLYILAPGTCQMISAFVTLFMSFGNYNPGWRCLDNITSLTANSTKDDLSSLEYTEGSCDDYDQCQNVEFDPETSTVVTEWGLLCDKEWIPSMIISLQMVGMLIGSFAGGQLSDFFGRKKIFYGSIAVTAILNVVSSFSVSWAMLLVIRFFLGVSIAFLVVTTSSNLTEFMTRKWRAELIILPYWNIGSIVQAFVVMGLKDWGNVERIGCAICVILLIPIFWVPESLRWLEVNGKTDEFLKVAKKIVSYNGKTLSSLEGLEISEHNEETRQKTHKHTILDLFRPGYKFQTISVVCILFSFSIIYYALSFGVKSLYGDFYINMVIANALPVPVIFSGMLASRYGNRTATSLIYLGTAVLCLFASIACIFSGSETAKEIGTTILLSIAKGAIDTAWYTLYAWVSEMYPTVIRCTALGFASLSARAGAILSPFVIPRDNSRLYIFIVISAVVLLVCCCLIIKLPETKGKKLKETFVDGEMKELPFIQNDSTSKQTDKNSPEISNDTLKIML